MEIGTHHPRPHEQTLTKRVELVVGGGVFSLHHFERGKVDSWDGGWLRNNPAIALPRSHYVLVCRGGIPRMKEINNWREMNVLPG